MKNAESDFMEGLLGDLNGIEDGTGKVSVSQNEYDETRNLLESLNEVGMDYGNMDYNGDMYVEPPRSGNDLYEHYDDFQAAEKLSNHYDRIPGEYVAPSYEEEPVHFNQNNEMAHHYDAPRIKPKQSWALSEAPVPGVKNMKMYSIKSNYDQKVLMDGMMMFEAAQTLVNLLNEGRSISDFRILGIISSGLQYTTVMNEAIQSARKRQKVLAESKYDVAKDLDVIIAEKKQAAKQLKERVISFLVDEGYITK